jgi:hypothetical protein
VYISSRMHANYKVLQSLEYMLCWTVLEERRQELKQLENLEEKTVKEVASAKEKLSHLQAEIEKLGRVDDLRVQTEIKCKVCIYSSPPALL